MSKVNLSNHVIYDIETAGAASEELVRAINPPYPEFDPSGVKTGDCRTPEAATKRSKRPGWPTANRRFVTGRKKWKSEPCRPKRAEY
jgi:hypothetical protein